MFVFTDISCYLHFFYWCLLFLLMFLLMFVVLPMLFTDINFVVFIVMYSNCNVLLLRTIPGMIIGSMKNLAQTIPMLFHLAFAHPWIGSTSQGLELYSLDTKKIHPGTLFNRSWEVSPNSIQWSNYASLVIHRATYISKAEIWWSTVKLLKRAGQSFDPLPQFTELTANWPMYVLSSLASQTFHSAKGEEKSGNLPILFWFAEFGIM